MHRLWGLAAVLLAGGCLREKVQYCNNGALCPEPLVCTENAGEPYCGNRDEVDQCMGKADESPCMFGSEPNGYCLSSLCTQCNPNFSFCRYTTWTAMTPQVNVELKSVWAASPTDVYVLGLVGAALRWNGRTWSTIPGIAADANHESIWGFNASTVYGVSLAAIDASRLWKYGGATWEKQLPAPSNIVTAIGGAAPDRVFTVGLGGEVGRFDGSAWGYSNPTTTVLNGVWAHDANSAVAVGANGTAIRYTHPNWAPDPTGTTHILTDVAGANNLELAVGRTAAQKAPAIVRHEGTTWTDMTAMLPSAPNIELRGVWVYSPTEAYAVGEGGLILRYDGAAWTTMPSGVPTALDEVFGTSTDVFAVGANGIVLRLSR